MTLQATVGRSVFLGDDGGGVIERFETRDYLIHGAELVLGGSPTLPQRGDQIEEMQGALTLVCEVRAPRNEPHFRWSDPYRKLLRIHTQQVA